MVQQYVIEKYEGRDITENDEIGIVRNKHDKEFLGDVFDVYDMVSNVHSKITDMTRDYTLANYDTGIINSKFPKFVREQRKVLRVIKSYLIIPLDILKQRFNDDYAKKTYNGLWKIYYEIQELLLGELDEMVIISRAGKGKVTKAMLLHGKTKEERDEMKIDENTSGVKEKLKEKEE